MKMFPGFLSRAVLCRAGLSRVPVLALVLAAVGAFAPAAEAAEAMAGPRAAVSVRSLSFSAAEDAQEVVVRNRGDVTLRIAGMRIVQARENDLDFYVRPAGPHALPPGESLTVTVTYRPMQTKVGPGRARQTFGALQIVTDDRTFPKDEGPSPRGFIVGVALRAGEAPHLLSLIVFFPLLAIPFILLVPRRREAATRWIALLATAVPLLLSLRLAAEFDPTVTRAAGNGGLQFIEHAVWIRSFNVEYFMGVDGLSLVLVLLTAVVTVVAVGASWSIPLTQQIRAYFSLICLLEVGMMGVFVSLDFFLFFVFWEVMLVPMYFLVGLWGGPRKEYAAVKFFLYTLAGSVLMLLAMIALYHASAPTTLADGTPAAHTFDLIKLAHANDFATQGPLLGFSFVRVCWVLLFIAFVIKIPAVPFHTWLPDAHVEAPTAVSVILAGILLKMGVYGLLRVSWPILPEATLWARDAVAWVGVTGILYGTLCAMAQTDLKRLVAYSSVGHMGFCLLGLASLTATGTSGAIFQLCSHGAVTSMLFLLVGVIYDRTHTRSLDAFGGLARVMPRYAALFGLAFVASLGLPGLSGFIGEALVFLGAFPAFTGLTVAAGLALVLTAAYHLKAIERVQLGPFNETWRSAVAGRDLDRRELATLVPLAIIVVVLGFWPSPILDTVAGGVKDLLATVNAAAASAVEAAGDGNPPPLP